MTLLALVVAVLGCIATAAWFGVSRRRKEEAELGVQALATMKWRDCIALVLEALQRDLAFDDEATRAQRSSAPAFFAVTSAFLLAELGDKTMLATVTLAADHDWVGVWIGSTLGMVAADALAIVVGAIAGKHLPERFIQLAAAALFVVFGVYMLVEGFFPAVPVAAIVAVAVGAVVIVGVALRALPQRLRPPVMRPEPASTSTPIDV